MAPADLAAVAALEAAHHAPLPPEGLGVFANRLGLFPPGCLAVGDPPAGYAVAHPWAGPPPALGTILPALPDAPDRLLLHDTVLAPPLRGRGLVEQLLARLDALALQHRLAHLALVAVHGTAPFWARHGFAPDPLSAAGYGRQATPMRRAVAPGPASA